MNGVALVLRALHHGEKHLAAELAAVAERHRTDHEVHHVATDLARWSRTHVQRLADAGRDRGVRLGGPAGAGAPGALSALRGRAAEAAVHRPEPGLLLLRDLRGLHLDAAGNSLYWEMLAQAARTSRDDRLLDLVSACHPQTLRQMRWTDTLIKDLSAQILTSP